jgi:hypothetical protein
MNHHPKSIRMFVIPAFVLGAVLLSRPGEARADWCVTGSSASGGGTQCFSSQMECMNFVSQLGPYVSHGGCYPTGQDAFPAAEQSQPSAEDEQRARDQAEKDQAEQAAADAQRRQEAQEAEEQARYAARLIVTRMRRITKRDENILCFPPPGRARLEPYPTFSKDPQDIEAYHLDHARWEHEMAVCEARRRAAEKQAAEKQAAEKQAPSTPAPAGPEKAVGQQSQPAPAAIAPLSGAAPTGSIGPRDPGPVTMRFPTVTGKSCQCDVEDTDERWKCLSNCFFDTETQSRPLGTPTTTVPPQP